MFLDKLLKLNKNISNDKIEKKRRKTEHLKLSKNKFSVNNFITDDYKKNNTDIDIITVSFNNPDVIRYQIRLIRKFCLDNYTIIICDNSNLKEKAESIKKVCEELNVTYIHVNTAQIAHGYSDSHGISLNWIFNNIIINRKNDFSILDHDIFPIKPLKLCDYINSQLFYGNTRIQDPPININKFWYLWIGFTFFKYDLFKNIKPNLNRWKRFGFIKVHGADTGSGLYPTIYKNININNYKFSDRYYYDIKNNVIPKIVDKSVIHTNLIEYFDNSNWVHIIAGSEWTDTKGKKELVYKMLDNILSN